MDGERRGAIAAAAAAPAVVHGPTACDRNWTCHSHDRNHRHIHTHTSLQLSLPSSGGDQPHMTPSHCGSTHHCRKHKTEPLNPPDQRGSPIIMDKGKDKPCQRPAANSQLCAVLPSASYADSCNASPPAAHRGSGRLIIVQQSAAPSGPSVLAGPGLCCHRKLSEPGFFLERATTLFVGEGYLFHRRGLLPLP